MIDKKILTLFTYPLTLIINILLVYILFFLCRLIFIGTNLSYFPHLNYEQLIKIFEGGILFDTSAILYTNLLYILLILLPFRFREKPGYQNLIKIIFFITNGLAIIANLIDTVYFQYTNKRTTASVFSQFENEDNIAKIVGFELIDHWYLTLIGIFLLFLLYKLYLKPVMVRVKNPWAYYLVNIFFLLVSIPLSVFGIRGGIGHDVRPITISNANQYVNRPIESAIVLNTPFSIYRTIGKRPFKNPHYFSNQEELESIYQPIHYPDSSNSFRPLNVIVLIMESMGKEYVGALNKTLENGNYEGYTPFLDSLITESLTFEYSYANGRGSIDGMPSILSGIPKFVESFFLTPASLNDLSSIGGELKKKGYYTAFFHGAQNSSMGFQAYARSAGYTDYFGRSEYNNDKDFDGRWAIWDEEFLQFFANKIGDFKEPFALGLFTATSHHPFVIPDRYKDIFIEDALPIHKCIRYTDNGLRKFFEKASKQSWFENTLFVITADHTNQTNHFEYQTEIGIFSVPIIFYHSNDEKLKGYKKELAQQIDIMPSVLSYLGYDLPFISFGCNLFKTPEDKRFVVNYVNDIYQYIEGDYLLQFDGEKSIGLYKFKDDVFLKNNLTGIESEIQNKMENKLKAIIQQYMERMNKNEMIIKK